MHLVHGVLSDELAVAHAVVKREGILCPVGAVPAGGGGEGQRVLEWTWHDLDASVTGVQVHAPDEEPDGVVERADCNTRDGPQRWQSASSRFDDRQWQRHCNGVRHLVRYSLVLNT